GIGQCRMCKQHLFHRERAWIVLVHRRPRAEERDLEAHRLAVIATEPTRDVPPLAAEIRKRAVIAGELDHRARSHRRIFGQQRGIRCRGGACHEQQHKHQRQPLHLTNHHASMAGLDPATQRKTKIARPVCSSHQSSRTAFTASNDSARRPESHAVPAAAAISPTVTVTNNVTGKRVCIVQWNDCGLTTWISTWLIASPKPIPATTPTVPNSAPSVSSIALICFRVTPR